MTPSQLLELWGDPVDIVDKIAMRQLEWLGHVVRMVDERLPKHLLFASMEKTRPACDPRKRWRDCILSDVRAWMRLTPGLSPLLPHGMNGALCSPPQ